MENWPHVPNRVSWPYIRTSEARGVPIMHAYVDGEREMDVGISHGALL